MIVHDVEQGSKEWIVLRLGRPTASRADVFLTPKTRKPSEQRDGYRIELLTEWLLGAPLQDGSTPWMQRGSSEEAAARSWYSFERDVDVERVGFVARDDGLFGGSPDGLVGEDGLVEFKVLSAKEHVRALLGEDGTAHYGQCQALLYVTGREWCDLVNYNPRIRSVIRRINRDDIYLQAFLPVLDEFVSRLEVEKSRLAEYRAEADEYAPLSHEETTALALEAERAQRAGIGVTDLLSAVMEGRWREVRRLREVLLSSVVRQ
jgi:hypothetical protein